jgi:nucleotide-binding universal stress UspA family protein
VFETVVVPLDGSMAAEDALEAAAALAERCGAGLVLARVVERERDVPAATAALVAAGEQLGDLRVEVAIPVDRDPARALTDLVADRPATLLCMATRGRGGLVGRVLLGSVADGVLQRSTAPVLLAGPRADIGAVPLVGPMAVCIDSPETAEVLLPLARRWAAAFGTTVELLHVGGDDALDRDALEALAAPLREDGGLDVEVTQLSGDAPARVIAEHIERRRHALVALRTHSRSGLARLAVGSVALAVVHDSPRPVLVVPPGLR